MPIQPTISEPKEFDTLEDGGIYRCTLKLSEDTRKGYKRNGDEVIRTDDDVAAIKWSYKVKTKHAFLTKWTYSYPGVSQRQGVYKELVKVYGWLPSQIPFHADDKGNLSVESQKLFFKLLNELENYEYDVTVAKNGQYNNIFKIQMIKESSNGIPDKPEVKEEGPPPIEDEDISFDDDDIPF